MKQLLKKLFLLLTVFVISLPIISTESYTTVVAGTEFEPISGTSGFFIKDKSGGDNSNLKFHNPDYFNQDIEVCDNKKIFDKNGKLYFLNNGFQYGGNDKNVIDAYKRASNKTSLNIHEYVVSKPVSIDKVASLTTIKTAEYSNNWMFITKTYSGPSTSILFYTLDNPKLNSNFKVEVGFANIANTTSGDLSVELKIEIYGYKDGTYTHRQYQNWSLNTGQTHIITSRKTSEFSSGDYEKIIVVIHNHKSANSHVLGIDFINVYSEMDIMDVTSTPEPKPYNKCVVTPGEDIQLSSRVTIPEGSTGKLKFYKDAALTQTAPASFNTGTSQNTIYYYTYQEEGKTISKTGELSINVKPNPVITLDSSLGNITECNASSISINANNSASVSTGSISKMVWTLNVDDTTDGVTIRNIDNKGNASVSFVGADRMKIFGKASAILTATTDGNCSVSSETPVIFTNNDCTQLTISSEVSAEGSVCEGSEVAYTFKLENNSEVDSKNIEVCLELPTELKPLKDKTELTISKSEGTNYNSLKWSIPTLNKGDYVTLEVKGVVDLITEEASKSVEAKATLCKVAGEILNKQTSSSVTVYNTPSIAVLNMNDKSLIEQCNNGTFSIKANSPTIGNGEWSFVPKKPEGVEIINKFSNETSVTGVEDGESVTVRWKVTNEACATETNYVDLLLKNNDCTKITISSDVSAKSEICEGGDVIYTFTVSNKSGIDSELIYVNITLPSELKPSKDKTELTITKSEGTDYNSSIWSIPTLKDGTSVTITFAGIVDLSGNEKSKTLTAIGKIDKIAGVSGETLDISPASSSVTVYNTPTVAELNMNDKSLIEQCYNGTFSIKANSPTIGKGEWSFVSAKPDGVEIDDKFSNETSVTGVGEGESVKVRWKVTNEACVAGENYKDVTLTNNSKPVLTVEYKDKQGNATTETNINCTNDELTAKLTGADTYKWDDISTDNPRVFTRKDATTTYKVVGTSDKGCESDPLEIIVTEDFVEPLIELIADTTYVTCRNESVELTVTVTNAKSDRTYSYKWEQDDETTSVTTSTFEAKDEAIYKVTVTDKTNGCYADVTKEDIKENKIIPTIEIIPLEAVCLPDTVDIAEAVATNSNADLVKYFANKELTQEVTETELSAEEGLVYYVVGYEYDNNGCKTTPFEIPVNVKPVSKTPVVKNYDECAKEGTKKLSSLVTSDKTNLKFFTDSTSTEPIEDIFDTSAENTSTTYWVENTESNSCVSKRDSFVVKIDGYIDFKLEASEEIVPAGKEVTFTITPFTDTVVSQYEWYRGDVNLQTGDDLELTEQVYTDANYSVTAVSRCDSQTRIVSIETIWPTAFTPHNQNGLNDTFAKGMKIMVFNRFYTKIFEGNDGWDGTINGSLNDKTDIAVPGVYYYSVLFPNGDVRKGTIEIIKVD